MFILNNKSNKINGRILSLISNQFKRICTSQISLEKDRLYATSTTTLQAENKKVLLQTNVVEKEDSISDFFRKPQNEPIFQYEKHSVDREKLMKAIETVQAECTEIPIMIGDKIYKSKIERIQCMPHDYRHCIAKYYYADSDMIHTAIEQTIVAQREWDMVPFAERFEIWRNIIRLIRYKYRYLLNAATMLGQGKTVIQAEIDSTVELADFFTFNAHAMRLALDYQPISTNPSETLNTWLYRGMEGFTAAITPFNFTAIAGNLAYTPVLAGNGVLWKPTDTAILSNYYIYHLCLEAGVPPSVINFIPADGPTFGEAITKSKHLAAINFTGSTNTFKCLWQKVGENISNYVNFPRMIGECGGKNFHLVCVDANIENAVNGTIRSAFEYSGQKCSACSRLYVSEPIWPEIKEGLVEGIKRLKIGSPTDFTTFTSAVIDETAFIRIKSYIEYAKRESHLKILVGGECDDSCGYFIKPTLIQTENPNDCLMCDEIFGPILTVYVYPQKELCQVLDLIKSSAYALTGSLYSQDACSLKYLMKELKYTTGNLYINDKSTGSVVGQQPFGGSRLSGTNDKAGGPYYVLRFTNPMVVKQSFVPLTNVNYSYMVE